MTDIPCDNKDCNGFPALVHRCVTCDVIECSRAKSQEREKIIKMIEDEIRLINTEQDKIEYRLGFSSNRYRTVIKVLEIIKEKIIIQNKGVEKE